MTMSGVRVEYSYALELEAMIFRRGTSKRISTWRHHSKFTVPIFINRWRGRRWWTRSAVQSRSSAWVWKRSSDWDRRKIMSWWRTSNGEGYDLLFFGRYTRYSRCSQSMSYIQDIKIFIRSIIVADLPLPPFRLNSRLISLSLSWCSVHTIKYCILQLLQATWKGDAMLAESSPKRSNVKKDEAQWTPNPIFPDYHRLSEIQPFQY